MIVKSVTKNAPVMKIYGNTLPADAPPELWLDTEAMGKVYRLSDVNGQAQVTADQLAALIRKESAGTNDTKDVT
jgi:hypothetical protein